MSNVVPFTGAYLSSDQAEAQAHADEAAEATRNATEFDLGDIKHRAQAINGALNTFDFVKITGVEFWSVYSDPTARAVFYDWALSAKAMIDDIVAVGGEHPIPDFYRKKIPDQAS